MIDPVYVSLQTLTRESAENRAGMQQRLLVSTLLVIYQCGYFIHLKRDTTSSLPLIVIVELTQIDHPARG